MMATRRERKQAKADRLREWADKRTAIAGATLDGINKRFGGDHAFNTQPGHIPLRARVIRQESAAFASMGKAADMTGRAIGIEQEMDRTIYSDDPDAIEQLTAKVERLEDKRDKMKAANAEYRKEHRAELKAMTAYERSMAVPHAGWELTNLGATIRQAKQRIKQVQAPPTWHGITVKYAGKCDKCGEAIERGAFAGYLRAEQALRCYECWTGKAPA